MAGKWCDEGENRVANVLFEATSPDATLYVGLYKNNTEPAEGAALTDLTEHAVANGYARQALARGTNFTVAGSVATADQVTFGPCSGSVWGDIYGYFITDVASGTAGKLLAVETFGDGPYDIGVGDSVKVTIAITIS